MFRWIVGSSTRPVTGPSTIRFIDNKNKILLEIKKNKAQPTFTERAFRFEYE